MMLQRTQLGLDSMSLTQLRGFLKMEFDLDLEEAELFDEETTLRTILAQLGVAEKTEDDDASSGGGAGGTAHPSTCKVVFCWCCKSSV